MEPVQSKFYKDNAVYEQLAIENKTSFFWVSGKTWLLIYGSKDKQPKVVLLVTEQKIKTNYFTQRLF